MKTNRSAFIRALGVLLASLLLAASLSAASGSLQIGPLRVGFKVDRPTTKLAEKLAPEVKEVKSKLDNGRLALIPVKDSDNKPAFLREDVASLIAQTRENLDKAIEKVQPSDLAPLRAWSAGEIEHIQAELRALPGPKTATPVSNLFGPSAVAVVASLGPPRHASPKAVAPKTVPPKPAAPPPDTVPAEKSNGVLDEVGKVVSRIFDLASNDDLEVKLWVGSTAKHTTFSFMSQGQIKGATPAPKIIQTNGKLDHVVRGIYVYKDAWAQGAVIQSIQYPSTAQIPSEPLDLVNGSRFFCCRFDQGYCHHVNDEKECRP